MTTEAQSTAFTADLRKAEKHPALARPKGQPVWMWISSGPRPDGERHCLEFLLCPPGHEKAEKTGFPRATAVLSRKTWRDGAWSEPEFMGYLTALDAKFMAKVMLDWDGEPLPGEWRGGPSVETTNV